MPKIIELILTEEKVGEGKEGDPKRRNRQLWTKSGRLVAEQDTYTNKNIVDFDSLK